MRFAVTGLADICATSYQVQSELNVRKRAFEDSWYQSIIFIVLGQQTIKAYSENSDNNVYGSGVHTTPCSNLKQIVYVQSIAL